ncbi:hypothetical protein AAE478_004154 [Parahypoxylon ruwenzoriense]
MSPPSIEEFKCALARLDHEIASIGGTSIPLCILCQPVQACLDEIIKARGQGFYGGARDGSNNITVGNIAHVFDHLSCPLCGLLARLVVHLKKIYLFKKAVDELIVSMSIDTIKNALLNLYEETEAGTGSPSNETESDDGSYGYDHDDDEWIEELGSDRFQLSVDAVPHTGAMSVWLPQDHSDEINDEESQLFLHPYDYEETFGDPPKYVFIPPPENGMHRNLELLKHCYDHCKTHHVDCGRLVSSAMPSRLVDTLEMRIIDVSQDSALEYVALSYVWGRTPFITLTSANLEFLQCYSSLREPSTPLPKTIEEAIQIGQFLGFRYIWIDSLCIKQDDENDQATEIQRMHDIYGNARLTIVAATGSSAQASLRDIDPETLSNEYHTIGGKRFCLDRPEFQHLVNFTTWSTRGWTLQELNCSSRLVYFLPERTYYSCSSGSWNEDFPLDLDISSEIYEQFLRDDDPKGVSFSRKDDPSDLYTEIVEKISQRQFTKDEDVLRALSGMYTMFILNQLGPAAGGVPINFLETGLMWQPAGRLRRRRARPPHQPQPTWSWAGWAGSVIYPFGKIGDTDIIPLIEWYLYLQIDKEEANIRYINVDVTNEVVKPSVTGKRTSWHTRPPGLENGVSFGKETAISTLQDNVHLPIPAPVILEHAILCCHTRTYVVPIKSIPGPELPTREGLCFFSILNGKDGATIGELKVDIGTLGVLVGAKPLPDTVEVLPIAELSFLSSFADGVLWRTRNSRLGQFSQDFMKLVDQDSDMLIVLWIDRQDGASRRVALGYMTRTGLSRCSGHDNWVILT